MVCEKVYYEYVYERLTVPHVDWNCGERRNIPKGQLGNEFTNLLNRIYEKYGFDLHRNVEDNIEKFLLWRREFCTADNDEAVYAAVYFVLYCCLADKILDSVRFSQKDKMNVCNELEGFWNQRDTESQTFPELTEMGQKVRTFLIADKQRKNSRFTLLAQKMERAFSSECFMFYHLLDKFDETMELSKLTDKSVEFVSAAFWIAAYDVNDDRMEKAAETIGEIFWLIDDVCDYISDIQTGSMNSALIFCTDTALSIPLERRIEQAAMNMGKMICMLEDKVKKLEILIGREMRDFILSELWNWMADVRKYVGVK